MYCRNCGKELNKNDEFCINCGNRPLNGKLFCRNCGASIKEESKFCVKCGQKINIYKFQ